MEHYECRTGLSKQMGGGEMRLRSRQVMQCAGSFLAKWQHAHPQLLPLAPVLQRTHAGLGRGAMLQAAGEGGSVDVKSSGGRGGRPQTLRQHRTWAAAAAVATGCLQRTSLCRTATRTCPWQLGGTGCPRASSAAGAAAVILTHHAAAGKEERVSEACPKSAGAFMVASLQADRQAGVLVAAHQSACRLR